MNHFFLDLWDHFYWNRKPTRGLGRQCCCCCGNSLFLAAGVEFFLADYIKRKFGQGHLNPSSGNNIYLESGLDTWEMLAGAGTCLDQSHSVLGRVAGLVAIIIRSKWV
jgi:hypothetical protein